jgi:hypothetical protein
LTLSPSASRKHSGPETVNNYAQRGNEKKAATAHSMATSTYAQAAGLPNMEPSAVLALRKYKPLTPYIAEAWERCRDSYFYGRVMGIFTQAVHLSFV